jgi:hypothetical protein
VTAGTEPERSQTATTESEPERRQTATADSDLSLSEVDAVEAADGDIDE